MSDEVSQRDFMRELVAKLGRDKNAVCRAYAIGERDGRVKRGSNTHEITPEAYAEALWNDGDGKSWL